MLMEIVSGNKVLTILPLGQDAWQYNENGKGVVSILPLNVRLKCCNEC
jgi:hypothetical protein